MPPRSECPKCGMAFSGHKAYLDGYSDGPPEAEDMLFVADLDNDGRSEPALSFFEFHELVTNFAGEAPAL